jgi:hypothetical protein
MARLTMWTVLAGVVAFGVARMAATPAPLTCLKSGEKISGQNKICYYDCAGSEAAITIKSYQLCPLSIKR